LIKLRKQHQKELKLMVSAFISKHDMYSKDEDDEDDAVVDSLTPDEIEEIMDMIRLKDKLEDINFHKQIE
jgi:hypothetical protein